MNTVSTTVIAVSLSLLWAAPTFADHRGKYEYCDTSREYRIDQRLDRQRHRIERGIDRDRLTYKEAKILKKKHRKIQRLSRKYRQDGYLSRKEFRRLNNKLNKNSDRIREFVGNGVERYVIYHDKYAHHQRY